MKRLAIFDLDDSLLCGDSEFHWAKFTVAKGFIKKEVYLEKIKEFEKDYRAGNLNFDEYCSFLLNPLIGMNIEKLNILVSDFIESHKEKLIDTTTFELLNKHKDDFRLIASGSLDFIVEGYSKYFKVDSFIGSSYEIIDNKITGRLKKAAFASGKLEKVQEWCDRNNYNLEESFFYTDSINDLPLIKACPNSIIISPDKKLEKYANENNLPILRR
tara:strand:- start:3382 stop:4026 length:645 start_codon:yes stop_codon:yes gene_type:complete